MADIVMPRLSDSMEEGTILKWLKADGDSVARGEPLAEIETDKATLTYESDAAGVLSIVVAAGETLPIGEVIARLDDGSGAEAARRPRTARAARPPRPRLRRPPPQLPPPRRARRRARACGARSRRAGRAAAPRRRRTPATELRPAIGRIKASPLARRIARELSVDLRLVTGTGPGGRVVKADVEEAAESGSAAVGSVPARTRRRARAGRDRRRGVAAAPPPPPPAPPPPPPPPPTPPPQKPGETGTAKGDITIQELTRIQQVIARRMAESKATVPEFTLRTEIDMEGCVQLRAQLKAIGGDVPSYNDMVVRACALALREYPRANGSYKDGKFELHSRVNVGVAVAATGRARRADDLRRRPQVAARDRP